MDETLQRLEESIAETWRYIDRQRSVIAILQEHGYLREVPTAEVLLQTLTVSLEVLCERKAILLDGMQPPAETVIELRLDPGTSGGSSALSQASSGNAGKPGVLTT